MRNRIIFLILGCLFAGTCVWAQESADSSVSAQSAPAVVSSSSVTPEQARLASEAVRYTLGPDDLINITVQRHTEFSGDFPINQEGKIQFRFVGDVDVNGLTKKEVEAKITGLISKYVSNPEVSVTILEYRSKYYFVIGEVGRPGKIYMRSETTTVRDAIIEAGLPTIAAAMRKCVLITPDKKKPRKKSVDIYAVLYGGNLKKNLEMRSGDTLYVPSTVMAKVFRTIAPITQPVTAAAEAQTGITTLNTRPSATAPANSQRY